MSEDERGDRAACPFYKDEHLPEGMTLEDHKAVCPLWHQPVSAEEARLSWMLPKRDTPNLK